MKTHVVIPIGIGAPGTPVQEYLENSVNCVLNQTSQDFILTVAADSNIPERCKEFLEKNNIQVKWFEPYSYFRKGGIWKKIFDTWKETDTKYITFLHYDDAWNLEKLEIQTRLMESQNLEGSWSESYICNKNLEVYWGDCAYPELSIKTVGNRFAAFAHSIVVSREAMINSGILDYQDFWVANFEDVWCLFFHKIKNVKKANGAKIFWRNHEMNISNTVREEQEFVKEQREITQYTLEETMKDMENMHMDLLINDIKLLYI